MKMRQMMAIVMTIVFLLVMITTAYAAPFTDIETNPHKSAIVEMARLGILEGVGNNEFAPEVELNRAAAAKVAAFLLGYTEEDAQEAAELDPLFNDVHKGMGQHEWALGWINLVANEGIIIGMPGGNYEPGSPLQMVQWVTILIRILEHEEAGMTWPDGYNQKASDLGLSEWLDYNGSSIVNRAEMARMTTTAIFDVERPDGQKIIDIVEFKIVEFEDEEPNDQEPQIYPDTDLSVTLDKNLVPAGGGQTIQITATVTHGPNHLPVSGANVEFFANAGDNDRRQYLSAINATTDSNGKATVTYTTLAADDGKQLMFMTNTPTEEGWIDVPTYALASNTASLIEGRVINPFTGEAVPNADVAVTGDGYYQKVTIDSTGRYSAAVNAGNYFIQYRINVSGDVPYTGEFSGSHFDLKSNGDLLYMIKKDLVSGQSYSLQSEMGIITGVTNLSAGSEIYIIDIGTGDTVIADIGANGRFMITLPPGNYEINGAGGHVMKASFMVEKGKINDTGSI
ncbi:MAG: S-layer homology domain-containing protein [Dethiosulfatibacter sp.]|nr:S-layer homology domain-containing protein [Dethiosulfatibacter sp.]